MGEISLEIKKFQENRNNYEKTKRKITKLWILSNFLKIMKKIKKKTNEIEVIGKNFKN